MRRMSESPLPARIIRFRDVPSYLGMDRNRQRGLDRAEPGRIDRHIFPLHQSRIDGNSRGARTRRAGARALRPIRIDESGRRDRGNNADSGR